MKKQSGITLIALVITIIVLLILAGVSISMVVGNNGVLTQASSAVVANKEASAREDVAMAWSSATTKYWGDWAGDATVNKDDYLTKASLDQYLPNGSLVEDPTYADGVYTVKYQKDGEIYIVQIDDRGNATVAEAGFANRKAPISAYGKTVQYAANGISAWKVFYADYNNIFLIASDYLVREKVPASAQMTYYAEETITPYAVWWNPIPEAQAVTSSLKSSFKWSSWTNYSANNASKSVSTLLNTSNWAGFVNATYADYAIGSPTVEMYCASWNDVYPDDKIYCNNTNEQGYYIGLTDHPTSYDTGIDVIKEKDGYNNTLYYPHQTPSGELYQMCTGYFLASPAAWNDGTRVLNVWSISGVGAYSHTDEFGSGFLALRPVIRLKSNVNLAMGTNGYDYDLAAE